MTAQPALYRISYSVYDEGIRPLPQFYFYIQAHSEQQALAGFDAYANARSINYRSLAVGYTLSLDELAQELGLPTAEDYSPEQLQQGIVVQRGSSAAIANALA